MTVRLLLARATLVVCAGMILSAPLAAQTGPAALKARHAALQPALAQNAYGRPMHIESKEASGALTGEVHAVVAHAFTDVQMALKSRGNWCDLLILPFNVKQCVAPADKDTLGVRIGRKFDQPLEDTYEVNFTYRLVASTADHLQVQLTAAEGPLSTRDYRIVVEAIPVAADRTFLRLSYSYAYGMAARLAMQGYLATSGSDKVGFSVVGRNDKGEPEHVKGIRGVVERNAMRYFLAVDAYLRQPRDGERRVRDWFAASERYALQLHEMDEAQYVQMKLRELQRQQTAGR